MPVSDAGNGHGVRRRGAAVPDAAEEPAGDLWESDFDGYAGCGRRRGIAATALPLERAVRLARSHGGAAYPAHIDRESNGILAILGAIPETPAFETLEVADPDRAQALAERYRRRVITASDAHHLWNIANAACTLPLYGGDAQQVRSALIRLLDGGGR